MLRGGLPHGEQYWRLLISSTPCTSVKGQVLADLVAEFAEPPLDEMIEV